MSARPATPARVGGTLRTAAQLITCFAVAGTAFAHGGAVAAPTTLRSWSWEPGVVLPLVCSAWLYARGLRRLRRATAAPGKLRSEAFYFFSGWCVLVVALVSPLHPWGRELFSAHMAQHELLMVAAAPLLVLGRPGLVFLWAFSRHTARELTLWNQALGGAAMGRVLARPWIASAVHALALWLWHAPALFQSTLVSEAAHAAQHLSFLGTALIFWQAVYFGPQRRLGLGLGVAGLFATILQSGALGALITFSRQTWYPDYASTTAAWGLTPLEDQQLGGLIMWVPGGLVYILVALTLAARWLRESDRAPSALPLPGSAQESR